MSHSMKVGDLARRTGLSVRTLHHYDEIGLLAPARRTASGHRLYGQDEVRRLQQIASLRQLGLSLDDIGACLDQEGVSLERTLDLQIERIREDVARQERLRGLLEALRDRLAGDEDVTVDDLTETIELTFRIDAHFTPEQTAVLRERRTEVGEDRIRQVQQEWADLFAAFTDAMERGVDPASEEVVALARRSAALVDEFTGGDPGIRASLDRMYREEGADNVVQAHGMSMAPGLWAYMGRARAALEGREPDAPSADGASVS